MDIYKIQYMQLIRYNTNKTNRNTGCPAINVNKMKHYESSTIQCTGETDTFPNTGPHEVPYLLSRSEYGQSML